MKTSLPVTFRATWKNPRTRETWVKEFNVACSNDMYLGLMFHAFKYLVSVERTS